MASCRARIYGFAGAWQVVAQVGQTSLRSRAPAKVRGKRRLIARSNSLGTAMQASSLTHGCGRWKLALMKNETWISALLGLALAGSLACGPKPPSTEDSGSADATGPTETVDPTETETGTDDPCTDAVFECFDKAQSVRVQCFDQCGDSGACDDLGCQAQCDAVYHATVAECAGDCEYPVEPECYSACNSEAVTCFTGDSCDPDDCSFIRHQCIAGECYFCHEYEIPYTYDGSCTISFPEPVLENKLAYTHVELESGEGHELLETGTCGGDDGFIFEDGFDAITLCNATCDAYELGGVTVVFTIPPCE